MTIWLCRGKELKDIQELLGYSSSKTTDRYTHMTKRGRDGLVSPFDLIDI